MKQPKNEQLLIMPDDRCTHNAIIGIAPPHSVFKISLTYNPGLLILHPTKRKFLSNQKQKTSNTSATKGSSYQLSTLNEARNFPMETHGKEKYEENVGYRWSRVY
jgi:hypothetical protein